VAHEGGTRGGHKSVGIKSLQECSELAMFDCTLFLHSRWKLCAGLILESIPTSTLKNPRLLTNDHFNPQLILSLHVFLTHYQPTCRLLIIIIIGEHLNRHRDLPVYHLWQSLNTSLIYISLLTMILSMTLRSVRPPNQ